MGDENSSAFPFKGFKVAARTRLVGFGGTYTTEEAAAELGVTSARVRQLILDGLLRTERFGRAHVITREALEAARQRQTTPGPAPKAKATKKGGKK